MLLFILRRAIINVLLAFSFSFLFANVYARELTETSFVYNARNWKTVKSLSLRKYYDNQNTLYGTDERAFGVRDNIAAAVI